MEDSQLICKEKSVPLPRTKQPILPRKVNITPASMLGLSIRDELYNGNKFGIEPGFAPGSERHANTSDFMTRHVTESSDAWQESVVVKEGNTWAQFQIDLEGYKIVQLIHEVELVKQLSHPNIIKFVIRLITESHPQQWHARRVLSQAIPYALSVFLSSLFDLT
ncbi:hypothetical protein F5148DRAFT_1324664 [Russula earlei]|uniref:Uncharacterized protein n=1 Tax=Russula earlei TaxID=71964 RepID=A0ACC0U1S0_9AGAM|nr:hypothetical protein F5148DRAFT_1324664 [Russula earlei]